MDRKDRAGPVCDPLLDLCLVQGVIVRTDVAEYRLKAVPYDGVSRGSKGKRGSDHFSLQAEGLDRQLQGHMAVYKQFQALHLHPLFQFFFQFFVELPHIGQPRGLPNRF